MASHSTHSNHTDHRRVRFGSQARQSLLAGFNTLADLMETTLGPYGRLVVISRETGPANKPPDLLNDGAAIARRVFELPQRFETMGLLLARHLAWKMEEDAGDGGATAVVIARHILNAGARCVAAGYDPMSLQRGLVKALALSQATLAGVARPLTSDQHIVTLASAISGSEQLGRFVQECFEIVGPDGAIEVRPSQSVAHDREYVQGALWNEGWLSSYFTTHGGSAILKKPYLLFATHRLRSAAQLTPVMSAIAADKDAASRGLVVIAFAVEGDALNVLVANKTRGTMPALAINAPGVGNERMDILRDLAMLCGGKLFAEEAGDRVENATLADLGRADEVQAVRSAFTIVGGKGRPAALRQRAAEIRKLIPVAKDTVERDRLAERAGKLMGGVAILHVGGATDTERDYLRSRAEEAVRVVRLGFEGGIVPGGGSAFVACLPALEQLRLPGDEASATMILREALLAPMKAIIRNAGHEPEPVVQRVLDQARTDEVGFGFDVRRGAIVNMIEAGIVDPLNVVTAALNAAVSGAAMALTTEALVHKPRSTRDSDVDLKP